MKMTQQPADEKKTDGLNINAREFVPFAPQQRETANYSSSNGYGYSGYDNSINANLGAGYGQHQGHHYQGYTNDRQGGSGGEWEDYECDPEAYDEYGYHDENGNFVAVDPEDHEGAEGDDGNGGMDSDEEAWMMEQIMKSEDEYDRVHGIVRDSKGAIVSVGSHGVENPSGSTSNANKVSNPSAFGANHEASAQQFAKRCVEDDEEEGSEPEPEFEDADGQK